jgi:hypothetical protein
LTETDLGTIPTGPVLCKILAGLFDQEYQSGMAWLDQIQEEGKVFSVKLDIFSYSPALFSTSGEFVTPRWRKE